MHTRMCTDPTTCKARQDARIEWTKTNNACTRAVVACNVTALRVCTLVLFILTVATLAFPSGSDYAHTCISL